MKLNPGDAVYALRHARQKVVDATQAFHELAFETPVIDGQRMQVLLLVAALLARATGPDILAAEYRRLLLATLPEPAYRTLLDGGELSGNAALDTLARY